MKHRPHIIVVGGGHAGVEAASAAARMHARVSLVTMTTASIGVMSCNPAIGGLGKGHLVREIDAMDGIMGRAADRAGIQYRLLNRRKGPAVQGPRAQMDRELYREAVQTELRNFKDLRIVEGLVTDLHIAADRVAGVVLADGDTIAGDAVILTTGTFLNGVIHVGSQTSAGGRMGERASTRLSERLYEMTLPMGRLKTGTPPRLLSKSIDWEVCDEQPGDVAPTFLSFLTRKVSASQVSCAITHTNEITHEIVRQNLSQSAMYSGNISGVGPRYCPSIEDKIARFSDKTSHQIFLEPEGLTSDLVYPNGISTSLPVDVQTDYVRSIRGLEAAEIRQPGYAIEYDYVDPRALSHSLELRDLPGLYLAGQINGTTGYEEAGAQGLVAGLCATAVAAAKQSPVFSRTTSYIGVMIDDLVTRGVSEPYRMFTSRAEFRLHLRADNADQRLTPSAIQMGIVGEGRRVAFEEKMSALDIGREKLGSVNIASKTARKLGVNVAEDGPNRSALALLSIPGTNVDMLKPALPQDLPSVEVMEQLAREAVYTNYLDRQQVEVERLRKDENTPIPTDFDPRSVSGLSSELREKLVEARPRSIAHAAKLEGMTPVALNAILLELRKASRRAAS